MRIDPEGVSTPGLRSADPSPALCLATGIPGEGLDVRQVLTEGKPHYGLALAAWHTQDELPMPVRRSFFRDLERLWKKHATADGSPEALEVNERRALAAARALMRGASRADVAATFGVAEDSLRRRGVWRRADEILANGGGPHPLREVGVGRVASSIYPGIVEPSHPYAVGFALVPVAGDPGRAPDITYHDSRTLLPRVWREGDDPPDLAGFRFLPRPRPSRAARDVRPFDECS